MKIFALACVCTSLLFGAASTLLVSCGDHHVDDNAREGTLEMALRTRGPAGAQYRLRNGTFSIAGPVSALVSSEDHPDSDAISVQLQPGDYTVTLESGWSLERDAGDGTFVEVPATLISPAVQPFEIVSRKTTKVRYRFETTGGTVELGGTLSISIDVEEPPLQCSWIGEIEQPIFNELGRLPRPGAVDTRPSAVSDDGRTVIGSALVPGEGWLAFLWNETEGMVDLSTSYGSLLVDAIALNCNGSALALSAPQGPVVWTHSGGIRPLLGCAGSDDFYISGMSESGSVLSGTCVAYDQPSPVMPARWQDWAEPGTPLPDFPRMGDLLDVSADGKVFAGIDLDGAPFRWSEADGLEVVAPGPAGMVRLSGDGRCVFATDFYTSELVRWCDGELTAMSVPPLDSPRVAVNYDGTVAIVSNDRDAWRWREDEGSAAPLLDVLADAGIDVQGWSALGVRDMTPDARVLVGVAFDAAAPNAASAFRLVLPHGL